MTPHELVAFARQHVYAVEATVSQTGTPQAAVVGIVVTERLEVFFDTLSSSRKHKNLLHNPRVALVIGWDSAQTLQYEGVADQPSGAELQELKHMYLARFEEGSERESLPDIAYIRVRPTWLRYSDFRDVEPRIIEYHGEDLQRTLAG